MMKHPSSSKYDYGQDLPDKGVSPALTFLTILIISIIILAKMFG